MLATGGHSEIVLNRGVGLHTIVGMTIDTSIGSCFDKASNMILKYEDLLKNKELRKEFI